MANMVEARVDSRRSSSSSRVVPANFDDEPCLAEITIEKQEEIKSSDNNFHGVSLAGIIKADDESYLLKEAYPHDVWLPITESRKGNTMTATFHLLNSGIGVQALALPYAFLSLGWYGGILCLSVLFLWQLYTKWLLVDLHESTPPNGIRYSRYLHLSIVAFGKKLGTLLAIFPVIYLSSASCAMYIISGGTTLEQFYRLVVCGTNNLTCDDDTVTGVVWFLVFVSVAIFIALFFPNLNSLALISIVGSVAALAYCSLLWILFVVKGRIEDEDLEMATNVSSGGIDDHGGRVFRQALSGIGFIALAFRGHNLVLEIQGTMPTSRKRPSRSRMLRGVTISYLFIAMCLYPLAIAGHWAYGDDKIYGNNSSILAAFTKFQKKNTPKSLIGAIYLLIIINYLCAFQLYAMPFFDNLQRIYTTKRNKPCPNWLRSLIKILFGGLEYFISVAFPFLPTLGLFIGSIALPLTLVYPCFMWVQLKKPRRFSKSWCLNLGFGYSGVVLSIMIACASL